MLVAGRNEFYCNYQLAVCGKVELYATRLFIAEGKCLFVSQWYPRDRSIALRAYYDVVPSRANR
jgi:hypothetical protein